MCRVLIPSLFDLMQPALDLILNKGKRRDFYCLKEQKSSNPLVFSKPGPKRAYSPPLYLPKNWVVPYKIVMKNWNLEGESIILAPISFFPPIHSVIKPVFDLHTQGWRKEGDVKRKTKGEINQRSLCGGCSVLARN